MKLSTANLSQTLQNLKPLKRLSGKVKRAAGARGAHKSGLAKNSAAKSAITSPSAVAERASKINGKADLDAKASPDAKAERSSSINKVAKISAAKTNSTKPGAIPGFIQKTKLAQSSKSARVVFHLLLVKPWVLVVGLWLVSALSAVVAIEGLVSPSKLTKDLPEPAVEVAPVAKANSFIDVEQGAEGITEDGNATAETEPPADEAVAANSRLPVWPLVTLVGSCAAGCVVISRRRAMLRIAAARAKGKGRKPQIAKTQNTPVRLKASNSQPTRRTVSAPDPLTPVTALQSTARLVDKTKEKGRDRSDEETAAASGKKRRQRKHSRTPQTAIKPSGKSRILASRSTAQQGGSSKPSLSTQKISAHSSEGDSSGQASARRKCCSGEPCQPFRLGRR